MADVLDQAQNFSGGVIAAARKRESWLRRAANTSDEETAAQYQEAAADLAARYPDIAELEPGQAEAFARERGHGSGSRSPVHGGRRRARTPAPARASQPKKTQGPSPERKPVPGLDPTARRQRSKGRRSSARPTPRVDRAIRQTGIPSAGAGAGSMILSLLGATIGMGLLFLVLNTAGEGGTGTTRLLRLIEHQVPGAVGRFLDPNRDIFPASSSSSVPGEPSYNEGHGSDIATAAARLKAAEGSPRRGPTAAQRRERHRRPQGPVHR